MFSPSTIPANTWTRVSVTFLTNSLDQSSFAVYPRYNLAAGDGTLYFKNAQLEYGKIATGWTPSSFDLSTVTNIVNSVKDPFEIRGTFADLRPQFHPDKAIAGYSFLSCTIEKHDIL